MEPMNTIVSTDDGLVLVRFLVPDFLPRTRETARRMFNDIDEDYCDDVWVMDDEWKSKEMHAALKLMDWGKVKVLEYDWDDTDMWGEKRHDPFEIWEESGKGGRAKSIEHLIAPDDGRAEKYAKLMGRESWKEWTPEELMRHPCWMFHYAKNVCRGRLPEILNNAMTMKSFEDGDSQWIKRYFSTKKYRKRNKKALALIPWAA